MSPKINKEVFRIEQVDASVYPKHRTMACVVVNDKGDILPYTVQSTFQRCKEAAIERWGEDIWNRLVALGARIVECEITLAIMPNNKVNTLINHA